MKKFSGIIFVMVCVLCVNFTGCSKPEVIDESINNAPPFIADLMNGMNALVKEHDLQFEARGYDEDGVLGNPTFLLDDKTNEYVTLQECEFMADPEQGFEVGPLFPDGEALRPDYIRDIVTATIMCLDTSISFDEARNKTDELFSTRTTEESEVYCSDVLEVGGYSLWFCDNRAIRFCEYFTVRATDRMFLEKYKTDRDYIDMTKELAELPPSYDKIYDHYKVVGVVKNSTTSKKFMKCSCVVEMADGGEVTIVYNFSDYPTSFNIGETYTFYGKALSLAELTDVDENVPKHTHLGLRYAE